MNYNWLSRFQIRGQEFTHERVEIDPMPNTANKERPMFGEALIDLRGGVIRLLGRSRPWPRPSQIEKRAPSRDANDLTSRHYTGAR